MALSRHHVGASKPLSVQEIVSQAQDFEFYIERPLQSWLRSARMLLTEASICEAEGNLQMAYLYVYRHAELIISKVPQHPDAKDPRLKEELSQARKQVNRNLVKLEQWKPRINQNYERYVKTMQYRNAETQRVYAERQMMAQGHLRKASTGSIDEGFDDDRTSLDVTENTQLAVELARQELQRRDLSRQSTRQAGLSPGTVAARRQGTVFGYSDASSSRDQSDESDSLSRSIRETGQLVQQHAQPPRKNAASMGSNAHIYNYPTVPAKGTGTDWGAAELSNRIPALPPKVAISEAQRTSPMIPAKLGIPVESDFSALPTEPSTPKRYMFRPSARTESGAPLRTVLLPPDLQRTFLNLAHPNTARNLETCGVLCATTISNALFISHLIIPDQTSTSDTCDTTEEGDVTLFDFCDRENLLVCGWIHTHPSQSCFLSSRDLHTSSGYQQMLPEAIAIVCAPRHNPDCGIFRLTDPPGLPAVLKCHKQGLFHPHEETNLYTDADASGGVGHVVEGPGMKFQVVDLRKS